MKKIVVYGFLSLLFCSCLNRSGNIVDLKTLDNKLQVGMSKKEVVDNLGFPKDSTLSETNNKSYDYKYETNDFSGYTLKIWFDKYDKVEFFRVD